MQKIIIVKSKNVPPEEELNEKLDALSNEWGIVSATTALAPYGDMDGAALHVYYVTTVVLEKKP